MKKKNNPSCDWKTPLTEKAPLTDKNRIYQHKGDCSWKGIPTEKYKDTEESWSSILRRVLIGDRGEDTRFHVRYFEIEPGGFSSFEKHRHSHVVIVIRGKGQIRIGEKTKTISYMDTVYIKGLTPHQLRNPYSEAFGFLCIVNSRRDRPRLLK